MFFFPIGTDCRQRRFPWMNVLIIALNIIIFLITNPAFQPVGWSRGLPFIPFSTILPQYTKYFLDPVHPQLWQFITYQFLHAGPSHIFFNMLFLYVFGNNLNEKLGDAGYIAFYLTGGILAGCGHIMTSTSPTLGASGSISAVTGLFLVLLPRTHIRMFVCLFFFYIDVWEIPSMFFVLFKVGQDVFEQAYASRTGVGNVAYMAHISGTAAGILIGLLLLLSHLVQRDHYDLLAMLNRYRRRKAYESVVASGYDPFGPASGKSTIGAGGIGGVAAVFNRKPTQTVVTDPRIISLRDEISRLIRLHDIPDASRRYLELRAIDSAQVLAEQDQLDIANQLMSNGQYAEAAAAYEDYLRVHSSSRQRDQIKLILGLIYARYLPRIERARELFAEALPRLHDPQLRDMAQAELAKLGPAPPPATA